MSALSQARLVRNHPGLIMLLAGLVVLEGAVGTSVKLVKGRNRGQRDMLAVAEMLADKVPEDSKIGAWNAGIYGYYSGRTVINLDGLINEEIARYVRQGRVNWPYWLDRHIDYLVDSEPFFRGVAMRHNGAELHKVFEYGPQYGSKPIVLYEITRRRDRRDSLGDEYPDQHTFGVAIGNLDSAGPPSASETVQPSAAPLPRDPPTGHSEGAR
jgi:hypothetical protein